MSFDFNEEFNRLTAEANEAVRAHLMPLDDDSPGMLSEAVRYSVLAGGKRLRPILMRSTYEMFGGSDDISDFMAAMEYIHCSSLIHDDLPALDNDRLRHGKDSTFVKYGEVLGILSGDALLNYAYEVLLNAAFASEDEKKASKAALIIAKKTGYRGMLGGQDADTEADKGLIKVSKQRDIEYIYYNKTCALFEAAMMAGGALAGANEDELGSLERCARAFGYAFQIRDDILDITGDEEKIGKPVLSDMKNNKATYVTLFGIPASAKKIDELTETALREINRLPGDNTFIAELIRRLADRDF